MSLPAGLHGRGGSRRARRQRRECNVWTLHGHRSRRRVCGCLGVRTISQRQTALIADYDLEHLGLASREGYVEGGREGRYDLRVSYDGQPLRLYDTGATPFKADGSNVGLPAAWIPAGSTDRMLLLGPNLAPVDIESNWSTVALLARYFASPSWTVFGEFRHQEHDGTGLTSASFLTEAMQLPQPFDYVTNSLQAGAAWAGRKAELFA